MNLHSLTERVAGRAARYDESGDFPEDDFADLREAGLLGLMTPRHLGGAGASFAEYTDVAVRLGSGSGATALIFNMHASVTGAFAHTPDDLVRQFGGAETFFAFRDRVLKAAAEGALYAVAMSERGIGSRLSQVRTSYERTNSGFRLHGAKTFVSGAGHADAYLVAARDNASEEPKISYFLVPAGPGVEVQRTWDSLGMRATGSHDLHLDTEVGEDALVGGIEGAALLLAQVMPQWLVASYAAVYVGVAQAVLRHGAEHLRERGLHTLPMVRARLGRADVQVAAAELVVRKAARLVTDDPGSPETNRWVWRAKLTAGDTAAGVAFSVLEAAGAAATRRGHPLERLYRDARCGALQPATSDVCADWLGAAALGDDPDEARW
ncbi:acyl-CoA dehydrogenase family protein [Lentzea sp. NBRC 102530]|uniref:acyl-CoA dehydrogenase family protein n=1 Tax=Lentzea sp. NBRC 102530 TaxID=3032201 RepID=UPI0024A6005D|nr:acyl-CoA dehydrogenase family protein [Lentzea sp. NBRC 102530]GLY50402.1 acyl-CoA dehydrogenase [Lentzea sp. NBRC 102530]